jgi:hypothetical protein
MILTLGRRLATYYGRRWMYSLDSRLWLLQLLAHPGPLILLTSVVLLACPALWSFTVDTLIL